MPPVRQLHHHVGPVGAHVGADLAHHVAGQAAAALALGGLAENALFGNGVRPGGHGLGGNLKLVGLPNDGVCEPLGVGDALHHRGGAPHGVAAGVDALYVGAEVRQALGVHLHAAGGEELAFHLLAHGGDYGVALDFHKFPGGLRLPAALLVGLAQLHFLAAELAVLLLHGGHQLQEAHAVGNGQLQLLRVGGHVLLRPAVHQGGGLRSSPESRPGGVHGGVAAADYRNMPQGHVLSGLQILQPADDGHHVAGDVQPPGLPRAHGEEDMGVPLRFQLGNRGGGGVQLDLRAHLGDQGRVLVDGFVGNAEAGDHLPDNAAQLIGFFKDGDGDARPAHEVGRRHAGGAAADDGHLLAAVGGGGGLHLGKIFVIAPLRGHQLGGPDLDGIIVIGPGALGLAAVGADGARDEGQGVLLADEPQGGGVFALPAQLNVLGNVLADGAAALAGGGEAVQQGHFLIELPPGQRLHGLDVVFVGPGRQGQGLDARHVHAGEGLELQGVQLVADLDEALVAAGLELGGGHGDGPDAQGEELVDVQRVGASGVADAHAAAELLRNPGRHGGGQGEEGLARHVHFLAG